MSKAQEIVPQTVAKFIKYCENYIIMGANIDFDFLAQSLTEICEHSLVSTGRPLNCLIIVNPAAGGFVRSKWKTNVRTFEEYRKKAMANPKRPMHKNVSLICTEGKGCARKITSKLIDEAVENQGPFNLIICAGGDGTHSEVMYALYSAPAHVRSSIAVLRLPLGTGNDGADKVSLAQALELLLVPVSVEFAPAVQLITSHNGPAHRKEPYLAFNILSAGLDAFVTHMTNKMKGKLPGDSYKLWLDIAALFYDRTYKVDYIEIRALDKHNREITFLREKFLILGMGASGNRTYGSQQNILPDDRNVFFMKQMPLWRKLVVKEQIKKGAHKNNPETTLLNAHRVEFSGLHPILAQMDGETIPLQLEDFPAAFELTAPVIPLLRKIN